MFVVSFFPASFFPATWKALALNFAQIQARASLIANRCKSN